MAPAAVDECSDPPCNRTLMVAMSPLHPLFYLDLACDRHRQAMIDTAPNDYARRLYEEYVPDDAMRAAWT